MEGIGRVMGPLYPSYGLVKDPDTGIWSLDVGILKKFFDRIEWKEVKE